jgi:hypothetical protein
MLERFSMRRENEKDGQNRNISDTWDFAGGRALSIGEKSRKFLCPKLRNGGSNMFGSSYHI